eukprot:scaffold6466_cov96-Isochrysis_galbana.AAC.1
MVLTAGTARCSQMPSYFLLLHLLSYVVTYIISNVTHNAFAPVQIFPAAPPSTLQGHTHANRHLDDNDNDHSRQ